MQQIKELVWLDLEMTGLDLIKDKIIEVAAIVTDKELNILDGNGFRKVIGIKENDIELMDEKVRQMHTDNGLIEACRNSQSTLPKVESDLITYLSQFTDENKAPLCGNSIATDRAFIMVQMKNLEDFLHYRNIDVSTLKQLFYIYKPDKKYNKPDSTHRALDDIKESINELKHYADILF